MNEYPRSDARNAEDIALLAGAALAMGDPELGHGRLTVTVAPAAWCHALEWARDELGCSSFDFLRGADDPSGVRVVAHLHCPARRHHLILCTLVPAGDLRLPTATGVYRAASRHERETHEMFGVHFTGHPIQDRLLQYGFEGLPLR